MAARRHPWFVSPAAMWERIQRISRFLWLKVLRIEATPHSIAMGLAAGVFIGLLPVLPFQTVLAIALAFLVRGNKLAAALGTWVSNPLNWVFCYMLFYYVGHAVLPFEVPALDINHVGMMELIHSGWRLFAVMMVGGLIVATPSAFLAYFVTYKLIVVYRRRKAMRMAARILKKKAEANVSPL